MNNPANPEARVNLGRWPCFSDEQIEAAVEVLRSGAVNYWTGEQGRTFEREYAASLGVKHAVAVSSGTAALEIALRALGIGPGDEVICPSFTFFATAGCVARVGAIPVFVDSRAECLNLDPAGIERRITARTRAIIPVHLFGQPADLDEIIEIARRHNLAVIEDAAQSFGAEYHGRPVGAIGEIGTVSFFPSKNLGGLGDSGLVVTNDAPLAERVRRLRNHGMHPKYMHATVGGNFRIDALQAALLGVKLPHLAEYTVRRQRNSAEYTRALSGMAAGAAVAISLPAIHPDRSHIANQYTIRVRRGPAWRPRESPRDALRNRLAERGIAAEIYYPLPLHAQECFRQFGPHPALPVAESKT